MSFIRDNSNITHEIFLGGHASRANLTESIILANGSQLTQLVSQSQFLTLSNGTSYYTLDDCMYYTIQAKFSGSGNMTCSIYISESNEYILPSQSAYYYDILQSRFGVTPPQTFTNLTNVTFMADQPVMANYGKLSYLVSGDSVGTGSLFVYLHKKY